MTASVYTVFRVFELAPSGNFRPVRSELMSYYDNKFLEAFESLESASEAIGLSGLRRAEYVILPVVVKRS
ncbi:MAG: hypothetical protein AAGA85_09405 [Bacteroidota bacterium]